MSAGSPTLAGVRENKASFLAEVEADRDDSARLSPPHSVSWVSGLDKCPFLERVVYRTMRGEMVKHYCIARGLRDVLDRDTWGKKCLKGEWCIIRESLQRDE